jgi:hypothetical protein
MAAIRNIAPTPEGARRPGHRAGHFDSEAVGSRSVTYAAGLRLSWTPTGRGNSADSPRPGDRERVTLDGIQGHERQDHSSLVAYRGNGHQYGIARVSADGPNTEGFTYNGLPQHLSDAKAAARWILDHPKFDVHLPSKSKPVPKRSLHVPAKAEPAVVLPYFDTHL